MKKHTHTDTCSYMVRAIQTKAMRKHSNWQKIYRSVFKMERAVDSWIVHFSSHDKWCDCCWFCSTSFCFLLVLSISFSSFFVLSKNCLFLFYLNGMELRFSAVNLKKCQYCDYRPKPFPPTTAKKREKLSHSKNIEFCFYNVRAEIKNEILFRVWKQTLESHLYWYIVIFLHIFYHHDWSLACKCFSFWYFVYSYAMRCIYYMVCQWRKIVYKVWPANKKFSVVKKIKRERENVR